MGEKTGVPESLLVQAWVPRLPGWKVARVVKGETPKEGTRARARAGARGARVARRPGAGVGAAAWPLVAVTKSWVALCASGGCRATRPGDTLRKHAQRLPSHSGAPAKVGGRRNYSFALFPLHVSSKFHRRGSPRPLSVRRLTRTDGLGVGVLVSFTDGVPPCGFSIFSLSRISTESGVFFLLEEFGVVILCWLSRLHNPRFSESNFLSSCSHDVIVSCGSF